MLLWLVERIGKDEAQERKKYILLGKGMSKRMNFHTWKFVDVNVVMLGGWGEMGGRSEKTYLYI